MKKGILIAMAGIVLAAGAAGMWIRAGRGEAPAAIKAAKTMYNCAMHPQYISDKPGDCPICGMKLVPMEKERADSGSHPAAAAAGEGKILYWRDPMHPWYTSDKPGQAPDCGMDLVPVREGDADAKGVRIDPTTVQNMGVKTEAVGLRDLQTEIRTSGMVKVDQSKLTSVNARVMGYAEKLYVSVTGEKVRKGQPLLELYSPDLVSTQEEYLQALRYARGNGGTDIGAGDLVESSRRRLLNWGISPGEIASLEKQGHARNTLAIVSPANGIVLDKMVVQGQNIMPGTELYRIADLSKVWIVASVYQRDLEVARVGAAAEVELSYLPGRTFKGKVASISPGLNEQTMTAELRVEVPNTPALDFRPEMYATVHIQSAARRRVVAVPEQAIIRSGRRNLAVVALGNGYFEPREVKLGAATNDYVEITEGLHEGERLVVSSQFLIDSESNLKAAIQQMQGGAMEGMSMGAPSPAPAAAPAPGPGPGSTAAPAAGGHAGMDMGGK